MLPRAGAKWERIQSGSVSRGKQRDLLELGLAPLRNDASLPAVPAIAERSPFERVNSPGSDMYKPT